MLNIDFFVGDHVRQIITCLINVALFYGRIETFLVGFEDFKSFLFYIFNRAMNVLSSNLIQAFVGNLLETLSKVAGITPFEMLNLAI